MIETDGPFPDLNQPIPYYKKVEPGQVIPAGIEPSMFISQNGDEAMYYQDSMHIIPYNEDTLLSFPLPQEFVDNAKPATMKLAELLWRKADAELRRFEKAEELNIGQEEYDKENKLIKSQVKGTFKIQQKTHTLATQWTPERDRLSVEWESIDEEEKKIIDVFIKEFFVSKNGIENLKYAIEELREFGVYREQHLQRLLQHASERIKSGGLNENAQDYSYKDGTYNINTREKAQILTALIDEAFEDSTDQINLATGQISRELLEFYLNHAKEVLGSNEDNPLAAFVYDYLSAASLKQDRRMFISQSRWLMVKIHSKDLKKQFLEEYEDECRKSLKDGYDFTLKAILYARKDRDLLTLFNAPSDDFMNQVITDANGNNISLHFERHDGLKAAIDFWAHLGEDDGIWSVIDSVKFNNKMSHVLETIPNGKENVYLSMDRILPRFQAHLLEYQQDSFPLGSSITTMFDKKKYFEGKREWASNRNGETVQFESSEEFKRFMEEFDWRGYSSLLQTTGLARQFFFRSFVTKAPETIEELDRLAEKNRVLQTRINDENIWFVATVGDKFSLKYNPDLEEFGLSSITIFPDKTTGGHRINLVADIKDVMGETVQISIYLGRNGTLYFENRYSVKTASWIQETAKNFVLKRIDFITSGALGSTAMARRIKEEAEGSEEIREAIIKRRHHYRHLTSTPGRVYTLMSPEAVKHADFILKKYGINIYDENIRRRQIGKLKPNQVITFVKELESEAAPNELVFQEDYREFLKQETQE